jgi:hypothetical protein
MCGAKYGHLVLVPMALPVFYINKSMATRFVIIAFVTSSRYHMPPIKEIQLSIMDLRTWNRGGEP